MTTYIYGTTKTSIAPVVYRNDLLTAEIYPDSDDYLDISGILQNGTDNVADRVAYQYNRLGERIWKRDQNGTIHTYEFDNLGRILEDRVTTLAAGVDNAVLRISTDYTPTGQVDALTSYDNATVGSGNVVNQVKYEYNAQNRLEKEYQAHSGSVDTSTTPFVGYSYDATKSGDLFTHALRPTSMTYPDGRDLYYGYGTSGSADDILNRVQTLTDDDQSTTLATYSYQGVQGIVKTELNEPGLTLDYTTSGALDRFGRVTDHAWQDSSSNNIVRIKHGYDRASNRLYREDPVARTATKEWDELYSYDGVNQLVSLERGSLTATKDSILSQSKNFAEDWDLDMTGNWSTFKQDTNGDGTFDLNQARTHNAANEILTIAGSSSNVSHDLNGNMTRVSQPADWSSNFDLTYDAWNRLVKVEDGETTVATYAYDARNHRVLKSISGTDRHFYYNQGWQCLEERVDSSTTADIQYVWGRRYIDDLILRDRSTERLYALADPNRNVVAITDENASVQSRLRYDAYGTASVFNASYASASLPASWTYTFTTRRLDAETGCMYYRNRYYHPKLGRFQKRDPLGFDAGDANLHRYAWSRPGALVDPKGTLPPAALPAIYWSLRIGVLVAGTLMTVSWFNPEESTFSELLGQTDVGDLDSTSFSVNPSGNGSNSRRCPKINAVDFTIFESEWKHRVWPWNSTRRLQINVNLTVMAGAVTGSLDSAGSSGTAPGVGFRVTGITLEAYRKPYECECNKYVGCVKGTVVVREVVDQPWPWYDNIDQKLKGAFWACGDATAGAE